jgi:hypothetical protein
MTISGEVVSAAAPEIDANTAAASLTLLLGTLVAMVARRRPNASGRETA